MRISALDLATRTGLCFGESGAMPSFETWNLGYASARGCRAYLLFNKLSEHIERFMPDKIYIEKPLNARTLIKIGATDETHIMLAGFVMVAEMVAARYGVPVISTVGAAEARRHFVGRANFAGKNEGKKASFARCKQLGWPVTTLDEADAAALYDIGCARERPSAWARAVAENRPAKVR